MAVLAPLVGGALGGYAAASFGFAAGTLGYAIGTGLGAMAGAALFPPKMPGVEGPRAADGLVQISTYGASIPIVYGTMALAGNVIWSSGIREVRVRTKVGSGKSKTKVTTYTYYCSFAVGLCEGEINCVRRVWLDSDLVYDASSTDPDVLTANADFLAGVTVHAGGESQLPDSLIEAHVGVGDAPAYRGLAYLVFDDLFLEPYGNRIPNARVELVRADLYYTSELYPIHVLEQFTAQAVPTGGSSWTSPEDGAEVDLTLISGALTTTVSYSSYTNWPAESLESSAALPSGTMEVVVKYGSYTNWPAESLESSAALTSGSMEVTVGYVSYTNWPAESLESSCALTSGSLS